MLISRHQTFHSYTRYLLKGELKFFVLSMNLKGHLTFFVNRKHYSLSESGEITEHETSSQNSNSCRYPLLSFLDKIKKKNDRSKEVSSQTEGKVIMPHHAVIYFTFRSPFTYNKVSTPPYIDNIYCHQQYLLSSLLSSISADLLLPSHQKKEWNFTMGHYI